MHEDRQASGSDVIMLMVVVRLNAIGHGLRRPAFYNTPDVLVVLSASRYAAVWFGNDLDFRPLI